MKKWKCDYDGTTRKLPDGRCYSCGRASKKESEDDAKLFEAISLLNHGLWAGVFHDAPVFKADVKKFLKRWKL
jgi:hypothetical protein